MNRQRAVELLARSKPELQRRFGVTRLGLFGSTARDTAPTLVTEKALRPELRPYIERELVSV
jgi:uncharacterized protein